MIEENFNNISKIEEENVIEKEVGEEILKLESNIEGLQQDIEKMGGEVGLQKELEENDLLKTLWTDRIKRTRDIIIGISTAIATVALGTANVSILPQMNWAVPEDQMVGGILIGVTISGILTSIIAIKDFIKYQKRVSKANEILSA